MNHFTITTETIDTSKEHTEGICWSSEWSFIEDVGVALQKSDRSAIVDKEGVDSAFRYPSLPRRF